MVSYIRSPGPLNYGDNVDPINPFSAEQAAALVKRARNVESNTVSDVIRKKRCAKCKEKRPITEFAKHDTSSDGVASYCNTCRNALNTKRRKENFSFRLKHHIATRVATQIGRNNLPEGYVKDLEGYLGYNITKLRRILNLDLKKREGITYRDAINRGYHLDHKKPLSRFNVKKITDKAFRDCWSPYNLSMISAKDNLAKGAKYSD